MKSPVLECNGTPFKMGDKVRIERKIESHDPDGMGEGKPWECSWNESMNAHLGREGYITLICQYGVKITGEGHPWMWPLAALRNLTVQGCTQYALKPFMRAVTRNGWQWIVVEHETVPGKQYLIREEGTLITRIWWPGDPREHKPEHEIIEVYEPPVWVHRLLMPKERGEMLWHEGLDIERAERAKTIRRIEQQRDELEARLAQLNKEQSECKPPSN